LFAINENAGETVSFIEGIPKEVPMQLITHRNQFNVLPLSPLKTHIQSRFDQLSEDTDLPPSIILVDDDDDITGPDYAFVGPRGLLSDLFEEHEPGHPEFSRPYEWVSHLPNLQLYEILLLLSGEDGYLMLIPEVVVELHPGLKWVLTSEAQGGLSPPQPL
jgi:hypothetical protein